MRPTSTLFLGFVVLVVSSACGSNPTSPSPIPSPGPTPSTGSIVLSASPPAGTTFTTTRCYSDEWDVYPCTSEAKFTFSVLFNRDIAGARVYVTLYTPDGRTCADASTDFQPLSAGAVTTLTTSSVNLVFCRLPAQTTQMVAVVINQTSDPPELLRQSFARDYTFLP